MQQRLVAEIVGPAGVGKSTLAQAFGKRGDRSITTGLSVWGLPLSLLLLNTFFLLPTFLRRALVLRRRSYWKEMGLVVRLNALHQFLGQARRGQSETVLMDEGAVFALVKLRTFERENVETGRAREWTRSILDRWAGTLDAVIWLDAPDAVLAQRIRERAKWHRVKDRTDAEIHEFLAHYRRSYEQVISELAERGDLRIIRLSTERQSSERLMEEILNGMDREKRAYVVG